MKNLSDIRVEIDDIDEQIYNLFSKRLEIVTDVAKYKIANDMDVFDPKREEEKLLGIAAKSQDALVGRSMVELFSQIMSISKKKQYRLLSDAGKGFKFDFDEIDEFSYKGEKVVHQGVSGAYSQKAVYDFFGSQVDCYHVPSFEEAVLAVTDGEASYAVIPIENSTAGIISCNYDFIYENDVVIIGEYIEKIEHALLGVKDANIEDIDSVFSHPQALAQCEAYIKSHKSWTANEMSNTAVAAEFVASENKRNQAAIGSIDNAKLHSLKVLEKNIQDIRNNMTKFLVLSKNRFYRKDADNILICYTLNDEEGALYKSLSHFVFNGLNMKHIESRPIKDRPWEYRFFVNFVGNLNDEAVINAIKGLSEETKELKILGNY